MRLSTLAAFSVLALAPLAQACPEVLLPIDRADPVFATKAWKAPLAAWKQGKMEVALAGFRKAGGRLEADATRLFQPGPDGKTAKNAAIQKFLEATVYGRPPSLIIDGDHFSFPLHVLWAWADSACRTGRLDEASAALAKVGRLRSDTDVRAHELALALRRGEWVAAGALLRDLPPDAFLTPLAEARIAAHEGRLDEAREKLTRAKLSALLPERSKLIETLLAELSNPKAP
jgi:hypothetical protein